MNPDVSIVIPAYNEEDSIKWVLKRLYKHVNSTIEVLVVVDDAGDSTINSVTSLGLNSLRVIIQPGNGPASAIKFGIQNCVGRIIVVTMADGSDDVRDINPMIDLIERGVDLVAASRYMPGGQQIGGPKFKKFLSKLAGRILYLTRNLGTRDATNSFKAYSKAFIDSVTIESEKGFEIGIELVAKAYKSGYRVAEVPTIWLDRESGKSNFHVIKWLPSYLKWFSYFYKPWSGKEAK